MADTVKQSTVEITVTDKNGDETTIAFNTDMVAFNQYINDIAASKDKIRPSFNHLMRTVIESDKEKLKQFILVDDNVPNGMAVMNIMGELTNEMGGAVEYTVKKSRN